MSECKAVYKAIVACTHALAKAGISKDRRNDQQGYKFRGIDDVYDALAPVLADNGLCFLPRVLSRSCEERTTAKGNPLFYVTVECEFDLVAADDGSIHTVKTYGEAMDSADKATNKAMSAAYKYAAFQTFCIPCEGEDADATTPAPAPKKPPQAPQRPAGDTAATDKDAEYVQRIKDALLLLFGDMAVPENKKAALDVVEEDSAWIDKETGEVKRKGTRDFTKLKGEPLKWLCHKIETRANKFKG